MNPVESVLGTRTNTNPDDTEADAVERSGNALPYLMCCRLNDTPPCKTAMASPPCVVRCEKDFKARLDTYYSGPSGLQGLSQKYWALYFAVRGILILIKNNPRH
jgi:hypothetical protein